MRTTTQASKHDITIWGAFETSDQIQAIINSFLDTKGRDRKNWNISYKKIPMERLDPMMDSTYDSTYEELLFSEIARGEGPDIFMAHNTWFKKYSDVMVPLYGGEDLQIIREDYVDTVSQDMIIDDMLFGIPLYVDNLALYYNPIYFRGTATSRPAQTWDQFISEIPEVEILDSTQGVSAIALGTSSNISRSSDIFMTLALQNGYDSEENYTYTAFADMRRNDPMRDYTRFADRSNQAFSWSESDDYFIDAFVGGDVASIVGYSYLIQEINAKASSGFDYRTAPLPQEDLRQPITLANYWAPALSVNSDDSAGSFEFLEFMAANSAGIAEIFNRPPATHADILTLKDDEIMGAFARQAKDAVSFPVWSNFRYDDIINRSIYGVNEENLQSRVALTLIDTEINRYISDLLTVRGLQAK